MRDFFFLGENEMIKVFTICGIPYPCIRNNIILNTSTVGLLKNLHHSTEVWNLIENDENYSGYDFRSDFMLCQAMLVITFTLNLLLLYHNHYYHYHHLDTKYFHVY